jgi:hypothetical protein
MRFKLSVNKDVYVHRVERGPDGLVHEPCWFCNGDVAFDPAKNDGAHATLTIEIWGRDEHVHAVCHSSCVDRGKGSLAS